MRAWISLVFVLGLPLLGACGGSEPEAEATWETHTTAEDDSGGEDDAAEDDAAEPD